MDELDGNPILVMPYDFAVAFDIFIILAEGSGHHHFLPDHEALFGLNVDAPPAYVLDRSTEQFPVGGEMGVLGAGNATIDPGFFVTAPTKSTFEGFI